MANTEFDREEAYKAQRERKALQTELCTESPRPDAPFIKWYESSDGVRHFDAQTARAAEQELREQR